MSAERRDFAGGDVTVLREGGVKVVVVLHGCGESWTRYVAVPRPAARVAGRRSRRFRAAVEAWARPVTGCQGNPGRAYWNQPQTTKGGQG